MLRTFNYNSFNFHGEIVNFQLDNAYEGLNIVNKGAQGYIIRCYDCCKGKEVAIKKLTINNDPYNAKRIYREFVISHALDHNNLIKLLDAFSPNLNNLNDIYITYELMDCSLENLLQKKKEDANNFNKLIRNPNNGNKLIRSCLYQLFCGIQYLHQLKIIHRDIKPDNILVKRSSNNFLFKICDLGISRPINENNINMTAYVFTWPYRAPEVQLFPDYSFSADIWSIGCVFAEILLNQKLFCRRENHLDMFFRVLYVVGFSPEYLTKFPSIIMHELNNVEPGFYGKCRIDEIFHDGLLPNWENYHFLNKDYIRFLLKRMLEFDPDSRITPDEAVELPIFNDFDQRNKNVKINAQLNFDTVNDENDLNQWKTLITNELQKYDNCRFDNNDSYIQ